MLLRLAEHGADMDMPQVTFDTGFDTIPAWTPLSLRAVDETWTDMRPASLSLRRAMEQAAGS